MTYLFLGSDTLAKDVKIAELKKKILPSADAQQFDYELLHGQKLDPEILKKAFLTLPTIAAKRLIVLRQCHKLNERNRALVVEFLKQALENVVLVLDFDELDAKSAFFRQLKPLVKLVSFEQGQAVNVFDVTRAISVRNPSEALKILHQLLSGDTHPLQIMGGLVWYWGKLKDRIAPESFRQGLVALQQADVNIKRSRLQPEHALEKLIVELASLQPK